MEMLDIVNESGKIVGQASRGEIHRKGLLHKEVHVWFYTPQDKIIFQHRAKDKDTFPDLLDATVGGHVGVGQTYEEAAIRETEEETGLTISFAELVSIATTITTSFDPVTKNTNHPRREVFAYWYQGEVKDLRVEQGKSLGFETWPVEKLLNLTPEEEARFIPAYTTEVGLEMYRKIRTAYAKNPR